MAKVNQDELNGSSSDLHPDYWDYEEDYYYDGGDENMKHTLISLVMNTHIFLNTKVKNYNDLISKFFGDYAKNLEIIQKNNYESE